MSFVLFCPKTQISSFIFVAYKTYKYSPCMDSVLLAIVFNTLSKCTSSCFVRQITNRGYNLTPKENLGCEWLGKVVNLSSFKRLEIRISETVRRIQDPLNMTFWFRVVEVFYNFDIICAQSSTPYCKNIIDEAQDFLFIF